ncbi:MAG: methyltransferase domain-containing protein [Chloroflexi bacterium]|nr:methyltransferase domain-containing protein [Chloroflexota bacterium]
MDIWKYHGITHRNHLLCNPTSEAKLDELVSLLPLNTGARVLDIACGKSELLLRIVERHDASGVGIDISPYEVENSKRRVLERQLEDSVEIVQGDGADYDAAPNSFDLTMCIGATWVWGGYLGTIEALKKIVKPGGLIAIGEPFKMKEPDADYVEAEPTFAPTLVTHAENVEIARNAGLKPLYVTVSNQDEWDRYESLQMLAAETYAEEHPDDPDVLELLERRRKADMDYLKWGRDTVNWAVYLFRAP